MSDPNFPSGQPDPLKGTPFEGMFDGSDPMFRPASVPTPSVTSSLAEIQKAAEPMVEAITGMKNQFVNQGWSEENAQRLALDIWTIAMKQSGML